MCNLVTDAGGAVVTLTVGGGANDIAIVTACATAVAMLVDKLKAALVQEPEQVPQRMQ